MGPRSLPRNITLNSMENLLFHSLTKIERWLYYQFSVPLLCISLLKVGRMYFLNLGVKGLIPNYALTVSKQATNWSSTETRGLEIVPTSQGHHGHLNITVETGPKETSRRSMTSTICSMARAVPFSAVQPRLSPGAGPGESERVSDWVSAVPAVNTVRRLGAGSPRRSVSVCTVRPDHSSDPLFIVHWWNCIQGTFFAEK